MNIGSGSTHRLLIAVAAPVLNPGLLVRLWRPSVAPSAWSRGEMMEPKMSESHRRSGTISCALGTCEDAPNTNGYASALRKHQSIKILPQLIRQIRSS